MNHWCSECGAEIKDGTICIECNREHGSEHVTYTFITFVADEQEQSESEQKPWWKIW